MDARLAQRGHGRGLGPDLCRHVPIIAPQFSSFVAGAIVANSGFLSAPALFCSGSAASVTFKGYMA
jgi:hypothetical protein